LVSEDKTVEVFTIMSMSCEEVLSEFEIVGGLDVAILGGRGWNIGMGLEVETDSAGGVQLSGGAVVMLAVDETVPDATKVELAKSAGL
jgi:hypothetical protein